MKPLAWQDLVFTITCEYNHCKLTHIYAYNHLVTTSVDHETINGLAHINVRQLSLYLRTPQINTVSLPYTKEKLQQAYDRHARQIWVFNVGDLKPLPVLLSLSLLIGLFLPIWPSRLFWWVVSIEAGLFC